MFQLKYEKFLKIINDYELIPKEIEKVAIAMSGGKDAQVLTALLLEYQQKERRDLELEIVTVAAPGWKYTPDKYFATDESKKGYIIEQKKAIDETREFWERKGIPYTYIHTVPGINEDILLNASKPCVWCFFGLYRALCKYLEDEYDKGKNITLAVGLTKFDLLYVLESLIIRSGGKTWEYDKIHDNQKYYFNRMQLSWFSPYPKLKIGIPNKEIYKITPIIDITDNETRELANAMGLPRIPDPCHKLFGDKFESDKRHFDRYLAGTTTEDVNLDHVNSGFFSQYESLLDTFTRVGVLPPIEEIDNILYDGLYNPLVTSVFRD
ncbi:MAG: hypothetical protein FWH57_00320 [Oscillospiraceae bacterium]|nr:hypothetical protein [Oscillospiraceae bacterium]